MSEPDAAVLPKDKGPSPVRKYINETLSYYYILPTFGLCEYTNDTTQKCTLQDDSIKTNNLFCCLKAYAILFSGFFSTLITSLIYQIAINKEDVHRKNLIITCVVVCSYLLLNLAVFHSRLKK